MRAITRYLKIRNKFNNLTNHLLSIIKIPKKIFQLMSLSISMWQILNVCFDFFSTALAYGKQWQIFNIQKLACPNQWAAKDIKIEIQILYLAMTFQDVVGIKVKHLNMFATLSSFLRAFGWIVMSKEVFAVPFEASL